MIRRSTWFTLVVFALLLGALLIYQQVAKTRLAGDSSEQMAEQDTLTPTALLFPIPAGETIVGLRIEDNQGDSLEIKRENEDGGWVYLDLEAVPDQDAINRVISQIETLSIDRSLDAGLDMTLTGLVDPMYTIQLMVSNGGVFTVYVGEITITNSSYYAQMVGQSPIVVSKFSLDSVINLLGSPPILELPTPTAGSEGGSE